MGKRVNAVVRMLAVAGSLAAATSFGATASLDKSRLYAHRGESIEAPENTLEAFRRAFADGVGVEVDLYMSLDGEVYLTHCWSAAMMKERSGIDKMPTNCTWKGELEKADAGGWRGKEWKGTPFARLDDVLAIAPADARIIFDVKDPRPAIAPLIRAAVDRHPQVKDENIILLGGVCKKLFPKCPALWCTLETRSWAKDAPVVPREEMLAKLQKSKRDGLSVRWNRDVVTADYIKFFNDAGYPVHVWTVNDPADAVLALERGAVTVTSDSPRRLLTLLDEAFAEPPAKEPGAYRMMTFNIWGPFFGNPVAERTDGVVATIRRESPDIVALQETTPEWWKSRLFALLKDEYGVVGDDRAGTQGRRTPNPILYRKALFDLVASGRDQFHEKLDASKGYTWATLREKATGRSFTTFSTHFWWQENGKESDALRLWNAERLAQGIVRDTPVIGGGDFNAKSGSDALSYLQGRGFSDAQQVAKEASTCTSWHGYPVRDWQRRYRGYVPREHDTAQESLDHVIANAGIEVLRHRVVRHPTAMDVSDHSPVVVDFKLKGN